LQVKHSPVQIDFLDLGRLNRGSLSLLETRHPDGRLAVLP
jgi:hypothetical protein